jgi:hypothetical protein
MFEQIRTGLGCRKYSAQLEDLVELDGPASEVDASLGSHLNECERCRAALADARLVSDLMRNTPPVNTHPDVFVARVMDRISSEVARQVGPLGIWRPIELLASRFALVAAAVLLALSVYLAEFAPPFRLPVSGSAQMESQVELGAGLPEPPAQPSDADEVLTSIAESPNGI